MSTSTMTKGDEAAGPKLEGDKAAGPKLRDVEARIQNQLIIITMKAMMFVTIMGIIKPAATNI